MLFSAALSDPWNGLLEYAITDLAHLMQDGFEFSVIGDRCFVEGTCCSDRAMLTVFALTLRLRRQARGSCGRTLP